MAGSTSQGEQYSCSECTTDLDIVVIQVHPGSRWNGVILQGVEDEDEGVIFSERPATLIMRLQQIGEQVPAEAFNLEVDPSPDTSEGPDALREWRHRQAAKSSAQRSEEAQAAAMRYRALRRTVHAKEHAHYNNVYWGRTPRTTERRGV